MNENLHIAYQRLHQFPKHRSMTIASFDKIFPGILPPKRVNLTPELDSDLVNTTDFISILDAFSPTSLTEAQVDAIMKSERDITGYSSGYKYQWLGREFPVPSLPIEQRVERGKSDIQYSRKILTQKKLPYSQARRKIRYDELRHTLANAIKATIATYIAERQETQMSEEDKQKEIDAWDIWIGYLDNDKTITPEYLADKREEKKLESQQQEVHDNIISLIDNIIKISASHPEICDEIKQIVNRYDTNNE